MATASATSGMSTQRMASQNPVNAYRQCPLHGWPAHKIATRATANPTASAGRTTQTTTSHSKPRRWPTPATSGSTSSLARAATTSTPWCRSVRHSGLTWCWLVPRLPPVVPMERACRGPLSSPSHPAGFQCGAWPTPLREHGWSLAHRLSAARSCRRRARHGQPPVCAQRRRGQQPGARTIRRQQRWPRLCGRWALGCRSRLPRSLSTTVVDGLSSPTSSPFPPSSTTVVDGRCRGPTPCLSD